MARNMTTITGGLHRLGTIGLPIWGPRIRPRSNGWKHWVIRLSAAISGALAFEIFLPLSINLLLCHVRRSPFFLPSEQVVLR